MAAGRCPGCGTLIDWHKAWMHCPVCGQPLQNEGGKFGEPPPVSMTKPLPPPPRRNLTVPLIALLAVGGTMLCCCGFGGFAFYGISVRPNVWLYVDNEGGDEAVQVWIDDDLAGRVEAGDVQKIATRSGRRQVRIERGGDTLLDEWFELETHHGEAPGKYVFDAIGDHHYWICEHEYSSMNVPPRRLGFFPPVRDIAILEEAGPWYELPRKCGYVLNEEVPSTLKGRGFESRHSLERISSADYAVIQQAQSGGLFPTDEKVAEVVARLLGAY